MQWRQVPPVLAQIGFSQRLCLALAVSLTAHVALLVPFSGTPPVNKAWVDQGRRMTAFLKGKIITSGQKERTEISTVSPATDSENPNLGNQNETGGAANPGKSTPDEEEKYFSEKELETRPKLQSEFILEFPDAPLGKKKASAIFVLFIEKTGTVSKVEVVRSELPKVFEASAINTFRNVLFSPAMKDGHPVRSTKKIQVEYEEIQSGNKRPSPVQYN